MSPFSKSTSIGWNSWIVVDGNGLSLKLLSVSRWPWQWSQLFGLFNICLYFIFVPDIHFSASLVYFYLQLCCQAILSLMIWPHGMAWPLAEQIHHWNEITQACPSRHRRRGAVNCWPTVPYTHRRHCTYPLAVRFSGSVNFLATIWPLIEILWPRFNISRRPIDEPLTLRQC